MSLTRARIAADHVTDVSFFAQLDILTDPQRLAALRQVALLDTPAEEAFDRVTRLASSVLRAPVSLISLVDEGRQFFKSSIGLQEPFASTREMPLSHSFCKYAVATREPLVVEDARTHPQLRMSPATADLGTIAYAGMPLITSEGHALGTLCVIDTHPRRWTEEQIGILRDLASGVMTEIALRHALLERARVEMKRRQVEKDMLRLTRRLRLLLHVAIEIGPSMKLDAPLDAALRSLVEALPEADTAAVLLHDPEADVLVPRAFVGLGDAYGRIRLHPGEGISGAAFQRGGSVRHNGADTGLALHAPLRPENVALLAEAATGTRPKFGYSVSVPLRTPTGGTVGALTLGSRRAAFSDDDLQLLEGLAAQMAVALDNDRLYKQVRQQANDLTVALNRLKQAQARVVQQERLRALGQLASGIAHDLNNTLAPVVGFSELLQVTGAPSLLTRQQREWLELIHTGAKDAAEVVRRLREFYRPRDAQEPLGSVDLAQVVGQTIAFTRPKWKDDTQSHGRTISLETDLQAVPLVKGNSAELREALTNLVINAIDAQPEGGTITIRTQTDGEQVLLEVRDTGTGMPEHVRQRCLEPFYSTKGARGTGLGLAMVHGTVERHQGQLEIESVPGEGTTIRLRLPAYDNEGKLRAPATPSERNVPLSVLVIDDEPAVRAVVAAMLTAEGHAVIQAETGQEGIERLAEGNVDLVVTDRAMPGGISGEHVARAVKQRSPETPVILLTGYGDLMAAAGEHPAGVDAILSKPVTLATLRTTITGLRTPAMAG